MNDVINHEQPIQATTPSQLIEVALRNGAGLDQLEKLMDMQLRWEANEARKAFVGAMAAFRAEAPKIEHNATGYDSRYTFAKLDHITQIINPLLSKHGLSYGWVMEQGDTITVHCDVTHVQGHSMRVSLSAGADTSGSKNSIQAIGSTLKYLERYTLLAALGLATGDNLDDDGGAPRNRAEQIFDDEAADVLREATTMEGLRVAWASLTPAERKTHKALQEECKEKLRGTA